MIQYEINWNFNHHPVGTFDRGFWLALEAMKKKYSENGIAETLIVKGADVNVKTAFGLSAIHFAMICKRKKIGQMLINSANFDDNVTTPFGQNLLQFAFHFGFTHSIPMLFQVDVPLNSRSPFCANRLTKLTTLCQRSQQTKRGY